MRQEDCLRGDRRWRIVNGTKICRGCFAEWNEQSLRCPWCGWADDTDFIKSGLHKGEAERKNLDAAGWETGMVLEKRYLLGMVYLKRSDYVIWRVYDSIMDIRCFFLVSVGGSLDVMKELGWGFLMQENEEECPVVLSFKEIDSRYALVFSMKDLYLPEDAFISWLQLERDGPERLIDHVEYVREQMTMKNVLPEDTILAGRYRIAGCIGIGGFGITYLCEDILLQRNVAVKEYFPGEWAEREGKYVMARSSGLLEAYRYGMRSFMQEVKMTAHVMYARYLITEYDTFLENDTAYIVLEYLSGTNIDKEMKKRGNRPYTPHEMAKIIVPVLKGMGEMHDKKMIHSDISPGNILRTDEGRIVLIDLGASKYKNKDSSIRRAAFLKKAYAAPEQYRISRNGTAQEEGPWTDIYAVGALMYYLLTGHKAVDALSRLSGEKTELIPPKKYKVKLKKGWMKLINQCMELDWSKRLSSARQVEEKLRGLLAYENW